MKIRVENKQRSCKGRKGVFKYCEAGQIKTGFLVFDENQRNVGIMFRSDDTRADRAIRYGMSEILFYEEYEHEFGTWKIVKINRKYLPYEELTRRLAERNTCEFYLD